MNFEKNKKGGESKEDEEEEIGGNLGIGLKGNVISGDGGSIEDGIVSGSSIQLHQPPNQPPSSQDQIK